MIDLTNPAILRLDSTKLKGFMRCPRYAFFQYVMGWQRESESVDLVFGRAWHEAMEVLMKKGYGEEALVEAYMKFEEVYRESIPPHMDQFNHPKIPSNAMMALASYVKTWSQDHNQFKVHYVEIAGKVMIDDNKAIHYRIDTVIEDRKMGEIWCLEHKTTKSLSSYWRAQFRQGFQAGTYTHVLYCVFPPERVQGVYINGVQIVDPPRTKSDGSAYANSRKVEFERLPVRYSPERMADWLDQANFYYDWFHQELANLDECKEGDVSMRAFPKCTESCSDFGGCEYLDVCTARPNPLQVMDRLPEGMTIRFWDPSDQEEKASEVINV